MNILQILVKLRDDIKTWVTKNLQYLNEKIDANNANITEIISKNISKTNNELLSHTNNNDIHVTIEDKANWDNKVDINHDHSAITGNAGSANKVNNSITIQLSGGLTENVDKFTFNGAENKDINISAESIGAANIDHGVHLQLGTTGATAFRGDYGDTAYAHSQSVHAPSNAQKNSDITKAEIEAKLTGQISSHSHAAQTNVSGNAGSADKVNNNLVVKLNGGSTEGTNRFTFDGSTAKTVNITPDSIGAASASHGTHVTYAITAPKAAAGTAAIGTSSKVAREDHVHPLQTTISGNAGSADKVNNALSIQLNGGTATSFDGSAAKSINITPASIGAAASHNHDAYVNKNAFANIKIGSTTIAADAVQDTVELVAGTNVTLTPDATNDKITITATDTTYGVATTSANGLMSSTDKSKLNGIAAGAQKNSDITKAEIEAKLTGTITTHNHDGMYYTETEIDNKVNTINTAISTAQTNAQNYADQQITALIDSAPEAMNTLNELAKSIQDHATEYEAYVNTVSTALAGKADKEHGVHLDLGESATNAYYGDKGKIAYDHSQAAHAPSNAQKNSDITKAEIEAKLIGTITSHNHNGVYTTRTDVEEIVASMPNTEVITNSIIDSAFTSIGL